MNSFEDIFEDYIEEIVLKSRQFSSKNVNYEIYVDVPHQDLKNEPLMKELFGEYKSLFRNLMFYKDDASDRETQIRVIRYNNNRYYLGYSFIGNYSTGAGSYSAGKKFDEDAYIKIIKKIGSYYEWKDEDGKLSENMEKKQTSLFSLLYKFVY